jgi:hypothetical protein
MPVKPPRIKKSIFVIMPFTETPKRNKDDLTEFFETNLKRPIESEETLKYQYIVKRSDDTFDITAQIIRDIYNADIVLCDLSGHNANPNVMYELGMRLGMSNKPVILFREEDPNNRRIFDIAGFYAREYRPQQYGKLESYIIGKLKKFETGEELYQSPVFTILRTEPNVLAEVDRNQVEKLLVSFHEEIGGLQRVLCAALGSFLSTYNVPHDFKTSDDAISFLHKNYEQLLELPWVNFVFHPFVMPAISTFLVDIPLMGLVPQDLATTVNTVVHEYYIQYQASDYMWHLPTIRVVYTFLGESLLLKQVLRGCVLLVRNTLSDKEEKDLIKKIYKSMAQSSLLQKETSTSTTNDQEVKSSVKTKKKPKKKKTQKTRSKNKKSKKEEI